jgi:hypothetical protein
MSVYEANIRSLAEFISDTKFGFMPLKVKSTTGYRGDNNSNYEISAYKICCDRIYVVNDCFIDIDGNIVVASYIPNIKYSLYTNELSGYYKDGEHLPFLFNCNSNVIRYKIGKDIELKSYDDFEECMAMLIEFIEQHIENAINSFDGGAWTIKNVDCDISWQVDKIKLK